MDSLERYLTGNVADLNTAQEEPKEPLRGVIRAVEA